MGRLLRQWDKPKKLRKVVINFLKGRKGRRRFSDRELAMTCLGHAYQVAGFSLQRLTVDTRDGSDRVVFECTNPLRLSQRLTARLALLKKGVPSDARGGRWEKLQWLYDWIGPGGGSSPHRVWGFCGWGELPSKLGFWPAARAQSTVDQPAGRLPPGLAVRV